MIRGAFILAIGFALGYGKAMNEVDDIREHLTTIIEKITSAENKEEKVDKVVDAVIYDESDINEGATHAE